jgi:hypothetical protein
MPLITVLTDTLLRWTLGSELTSISIEDNMQEMIALGVGFLTEMPSTLEDDMNLPVYISEPLVVLSLRMIFEIQRWTTMKALMTRSFRNAFVTTWYGLLHYANLIRQTGPIIFFQPT